MPVKDPAQYEEFLVHLGYPKEWSRGGFPSDGGVALFISRGLGRAVQASAETMMQFQKDQAVIDHMPWTKAAVVACTRCRGTVP